LRREPARVGDHLVRARKNADAAGEKKRNEHQEGRSGADQDMGFEPGRLAMVLALETEYETRSDAGEQAGQYGNVIAHALSIS
jgi:hypothetical protein